MKTLILSASILLLVATLHAEIDPPNFRWGAYSPGWRGNGHGLTNVNPKPNSTVTNMTFVTGAAVAFGSIDQFAGVTLSDTNGFAKFLFDGFASSLSLMDKTATSRLSIDANNTFALHSPTVTGTLLAADFHGNGANITNINAANITGNLNIDTLTVSTQIVTGSLIGNGPGLTNLNATNISSTFSLAQIAGGFGANAFWLGQNAVLISDSFMGGAIDPRLAGSTASGGSAGLVSPNVVGMNGTWRVGSYPTNTASYGLLRMIPSGGAYFSNKLSMDVGLQMTGYELTEHVVGAVNATTTIAVTDAIRWVANTNWSANWIANCMSNSVATFVTSSVPVTINSTIRLSVDADFTSARFYTNGVIACTIETSIPAGRIIVPIVRSMATANTGSSTIQYNYSDYIWVLYY